MEESQKDTVVGVLGVVGGPSGFCYIHHSDTPSVSSDKTGFLVAHWFGLCRYIL